MDGCETWTTSLLGPTDMELSLEGAACRRGRGKGEGEGRVGFLSSSDNFDFSFFFRGRKEGAILPFLTGGLSGCKVKK